MAGKKKLLEVSLDLEPLYSESNNTKMSLEYYLIEDIYKDEEETQNSYKTFGVEVIKKEYLPNNIINIEKKSARHLSLNKQKVETLLDNLAKNYVTPVSLFNVLDNLIGVNY